MRILSHRLHDDDDQRVAFAASPNFTRGVRLEPQLLVMHYTAGRDAAGSIAWLTNPDARASAHVVIGRDGAVTQLVRFDRRAWHAGRSFWQGHTGVNRIALGIELDNAGRLSRAGDHWTAWFGGRYADAEVGMATHKHESEPSGWHRFPEAQLEAALAVASALVRHYDLVDVVGHDDVSPGRKQDPGPLFPLVPFRSRVLGRQADDPVVLEATVHLNIRLGPGVDHPTLPDSPLAPGTRVEVLDEAAAWRLVNVLAPDAADCQGWVHGGFLRRVE